MIQKDLNKKMNTAAKWSSLAEICAKLIAPVTTAVLARLLAPEAFGVVATLTLVVSFAEVFTDAGFQKYLVQHQFADEDDLQISTNVAFWTNLTFSLLLWVIIAVFATPITNLVGSPGCEPAVIVMSMQIPLVAFSSIQTARYRRDFDFRSLFYAKMATTLVPLVVTVPLALIFKSYWALVWGTLAKEAMNAAILTFKSRWKPSLCYRMEKLMEMISFSFWTMIENVTVWISVNVDVFLVSMALSTFHLGLYKTSLSTVNSIMTLITGATMPVLFSALARCQNDEGEFREVFYQFQKMVALVVLPMGFGLYIYRELATEILLGSQWVDTADFIGLWSLISAISIVFHNFNASAVISRGRPKLSVLTQMLHIVVLIPVVIYFRHQSYGALTVARCLVRFEMIAASSCVAFFAFRLNVFVSLRNVLPQFTASIVMAAAGAWLRTLGRGTIYEFFTIFLCCIVYALCMFLIPGGRKQLYDVPVLKKLLKRGH